MQQNLLWINCEIVRLISSCIKIVWMNGKGLSMAVIIFLCEKVVVNNLEMLYLLMIFEKGSTLSDNILTKKSDRFLAW